MRGDADDYPDPQELVAVGHGGVEGVAESLGLVPGITSLPVAPTGDSHRSAITVLVTDFADGTAPPVEWLDRLSTREGLTLGVVATPATAADLDPATAREMARLRGAVDSTVVVPPGYHRRGVRSVVTTLHELIVRPGVINLDPADIRTVLSGCDAASIATGSAGETGDMAADAVNAVSAAMDAPYIDVDGLEAVLVNVVGGADLTLASAVEAADGIQHAIPEGAVLIWGVAVEESVSAIHAQVVASSDRTPVFDRVLSAARELSAGDDCPRCGGPVAVYSLGERRTAACDDCGYSSTPTTL